MVLIPRPEDKWLKLESLQIEISQFLIIGKVSYIFKWSKGIHLSLNSVLSISFKISCSSLFLPVAKKNLHSWTLEIRRISSIKVLAGILLVGPDPPTPSKIFFLSLLNILSLGPSPCFCFSAHP